MQDPGKQIDHVSSSTQKLTQFTGDILQYCPIGVPIISHKISRIRVKDIAIALQISSPTVSSICTGCRSSQHRPQRGIHVPNSFKSNSITSPLSTRGRKGGYRCQGAITELRRPAKQEPPKLSPTADKTVNVLASVDVGVEYLGRRLYFWSGCH